MRGNPPGETVGGSQPPDEPVNVEGLFADLDRLTGQTSTTRVDTEVAELKELLARAHERDLIGSGVRRLDPKDAAEALVGSVIFATPLLVEDGVFAIGTFLFDSLVYGVPVFLIANTLFVVLMTHALLEWTGKDKQETRLVFGAVPARLVMVLVISFVVATVLMTVWGRVGGWAVPLEALARINVVWTVGSLGGALGDIVSEDDPSPVVAEMRGAADAGPTESDAAVEASQLTDAALFDAISAEFEDLESAVADPAARRDVRQLKQQTSRAAFDTVFNDRVRKYTSRDIAEAFVGSVFFSIGFLVEDGVFEVAAFLLGFKLAQFPVYFLVNTTFVLVLVAGLVYWAGPQNVQVSRPLFGFIPRRLLGIAVVSFLTVAALMTMWGRIGGWQEPATAIARVSVIWTIASFGAALGDILPGESSGDDINDDLAELGDRVEEFVD